MKPMLAATLSGTAPFFPLLVSPKLDGIRCLIVNGVVLSRSLKPIPNKYVQQLFGHKKFNGLDGELIVGRDTDSQVFQATTSGVMSIEGEPDVRFHVFDDFSDDISFCYRLANAHNRVKKEKHFETVEHHEVTNERCLLKWEEKFLVCGYEGLMARHPMGLYKHGRSTLKEGGLLKLKRFLDGEAKIIGWKQLETNQNEATVNALGQKERSSKKSGKIAVEKLGALIVQDLKTGVEFDVGSGFTDAQRIEFWRQPLRLRNNVIKYKYQPIGVKEKPRFPVFLGFRALEDL